MSLAVEIRHSLRALRHSRTASITSALALGGGVGLLTALFSIVNAAILRPLPFPNARRVVALTEGLPRAGQWASNVSPAALDAIARNTSSLAAVAAYAERGMNAVVAGTTVMLIGASVSPNAFEILGERPLLGRVLQPGDEREGVPPVVISEETWNTHFGRAANVIGTRIRIDDVEHVIVGVTADRFVFPDRAVLWKPLDVRSAGLRWTGETWSAIGLLRPGASAATVRSQLATLATAIEPSRPMREPGWTLSASPDAVERRMVPGPIPWMFLGAGVLALLVVCANVATVLLARALSRRPEMALRAAVGGTRARLVRLGTIDAIVLGLAGGVIGLVTSVAGIGVARIWLPLGAMPRWLDFAVDWRVLAFASAAASFAALAAGIGPALFGSRVDLAGPLKLGAPGDTAARGELRITRVLVVAEIAFAFVLIACSALFLQSARHLAAVDPGIDAERVLLTTISFGEREYADTARREAFFAGGMERLSALPSVESAATESNFWSLRNETPNPDSASWRYDPVAVLRRGESLTRATTPRAPYIARHAVSPDYFRTLGFRLLEGRAFTAQDRDGAPRVAVVSSAFAKMHWPGGRALGHEFRLAKSLDWITVVGVVSDLHRGTGGARGLGATAQAALYVPNAQAQMGFTRFLIRATGDPMGIATDVRAALAQIDPRHPVARFDVLAEDLRGTAQMGRYLGVSFMVIAVGTWLLAAMGLYGIVSYTVVRRTRELGVRMALGADAARLRRDVLRGGLRLGAWGLVIGAPLTWAGATLVRGFLYGVSPLDPTVYLTSSIVFLFVTGAASLVPARRATRVDPVQSLRA
jgi:putative ABC transport system permease protein